MNTSVLHALRPSDCEGAGLMAPDAWDCEGATVPVLSASFATSTTLED